MEPLSISHGNTKTGPVQDNIKINGVTDWPNLPIATLYWNQAMLQK